MFNRKTTEAVITQTRLNDKGIPGSFKVPGVVSFDTKDGCLQGLDRRGKVIVLVDLKDVAAAVIEVTK